MFATAGIAAVLLLAGCGTPAGPAAAPPASQGPAAAPGAGSPAESGGMTVSALDGSSLKLPTGKPTVIYFFTASCGPCAAGVKNVASGLAKTPGATAVAVDLDPSEPTAVLKQFMGSVGNPPLTFVRDDGTLLKQFNVDALGTTVVLNPSGKEVYRGVDPSADQTAKALAAAAS
ncbi:MAG: hypothetical protein NVS2B15_24410 [Pseudarthrobacter sp.]